MTQTHPKEAPAIGAGVTISGQYAIIKRLGAGAVGDVFLATDLALDRYVAIKLLQPALAQRLESDARFRREARLLSRLTHPHIVTVHAFGSLAEGPSFIVMEYVEGRDLSRVLEDKGRLEPQVFCHVMRQICAAVGEAHRQGVVHRDLKPSNVLVFERGEERAFKVADFGLSHAIDEEVEDSRKNVRGTPAYMAPEQITNEVRDHGPWTDLYALGCLVYELVAGHAPFSDPKIDVVDLLGRHLSAPPPPVPHDRIPLPPGFQAWLNRLLAKRPDHRFRRAADAAHALLQLPEPMPLELRSRPPIAASEPTLDSQGTLGFLTTVLTPAEGVPGVASSDSGLFDLPAPEVEASDRPPLPASWARGTARRQSMRLVGAGLGLFGLRPVPMVDRTGERDLIWARLGEVDRQGRPRAVVLRGFPGGGKSRLAQWTAERAHEVGAAIVLKASHGQILAPGDGLAGMLVRHLGCMGLTPSEMVVRLQTRGREAPDEARALAALMAPAARAAEGGEGAPPIRFSGPEERYAVVRRHLERLVRERPVLLWVDDAQWGGDALALVDHLMQRRTRGQRFPVLSVLAVDDVALATRPLERERLDTLLARRGVEALEVGPLEPQDRRELVGSLLGLAGGLASDVEERSEGNPLFAVRLVADWVRRGLLVVGDEGFELEPGAEAELPDDIHALWSEQLARLAARLGGDEALVALEVAAVLGSDVDAAEWADACALAGARIEAGLEEELVQAGLAQESERGFALTHSLARESLERRAREGGRLASHHAACAQMVATRYAEGTPGREERRAQHLLGAGRPAEALGPLEAAARARREQADFRAAYGLYDQLEATLDRLQAPADDPRRVRGWVQRAHAAIKHGLLDDALGRLAAAEAALGGGEAQPATRARIAWLRGMAAQGRGDTDGAIESLERARDLAERANARRVRRRALSGLAALRKAVGDLRGAAAQGTEALKLAEAGGDPDERAECQLLLGDILGRMGSVDRGVALVTEALAHQRRVGNRFAEAWGENALGDLARSRARFQEAEGHYERALALRERMESPYVEVTRLNLALTLLAREKYEEAERALTHARERLGEGSGFLSFVYAQLMACAAAGGRWEDWDRYETALGAVLADNPMVDDDLAWPLELAGRLAAESGEEARALSALRRAEVQWATMGKREQAEAARIKADTIR